MFHTRDHLVFLFVVGCPWSSNTLICALSIIADQRALPPFGALELQAPFPVTVRVDPVGQERIIITAPPEQASHIRRIRTFVNGDQLVIVSGYEMQCFEAGPTHGPVTITVNKASVTSITASSTGLGSVICHNQPHPLPDVRIHVTTRHIRAISIPSYGSVTVEPSSPVSTPDLQLSVSGAGSITIPTAFANGIQVALSGAGSIRLPAVQADFVGTSLSGTGRIILAGQTRQLNVDLSGVGQLDAGNLLAGNGYVSASGIGRAIINALYSLSGSVSGMGSVGYKGHPRVDISNSGFGRVYQIS
ncbi:uncharacterized protein LOC129598800 [Paramacrobiotus metropolitanus]|uniref:uncharacterized protein LOC129598800 n=1 Tax=Paramacrobiotus metropolitanus TaxID=2943436 RepID=UPI0024462D5D|nr:uncharacterized protein LOC129598800 [Paramacrobiotus metropolitanus]